MNDVKLAFWQLMKNPGFTTMAAFTLALGIGANTVVFSILNEVHIRPLPLPIRRYDTSCCRVIVFANSDGRIHIDALNPMRDEASTMMLHAVR